MLELAYSAVVCPHYILEGKEIEKTVIMGPIRIFETVKEDSVRAHDIIIGCSRFRACEDVNCAYSWVSRMERKKEKEQVQP